jgi:hypothetical protein
MAKKTKSASAKQPAGARRIFADVLSATEMAAHRRKDGIVLLPLGCFEMHGPHASMACDSFLAEASCRILAEEWDAIIMPTIHYTYPGASTPWPGTVSISFRETLDYVVAVMKAILRNGFRRLVVISLHGPSNSMVDLALRTVFEETGEIPILFAVPYGEISQEILKQYGANHDEGAQLLASLYICGRHGEFDPRATEAEKLEGPGWPFPSVSRLRRHGVNFPYYFVKPNNHVGRYPGLTLADAPKLAELYRRMILEKARGLPEDYAAYQRDMRKAFKDAPWKDMK